MSSSVITRSFLVVLLSLFTLLATTTPVGAQTAAKQYSFTVNTTADTHDANWGNGVCADQQGRCSLRAAIEEADTLPYGSKVTIVVPTGTYRLLKGTLRFSAHRSIMIHGASSKTTIIEGNKTFRIMTIGSPDLFVELGGLTIEMGKSNYQGGGIDNYGVLSVTNSAISNNSANGYGGSIANESGGTLTVSDSTISNNSANSYGGGIANSGTMIVSNSIISNNATVDSNGGGIDNTGTLTIRKSTISSNKALYGNGHGGGIENDGSLIMGNSTIINNTTDYGGGIYNTDWITIHTSTISENSATADGGIENDAGTLSVSNSTISNNSAYEGSGGIANDSGNLSISNSTINGNLNRESGGGISTTGPASVVNSIVSNNSANDGGGIDNAGPLTIANSTFSGNSATFGGGMANNTSTPVMVDSSTFSGNSADFGGGIENEGVLNVSNSTISNNKATDGGGIENDHGTLSVSNSTFGGNQVPGGSAASIDNLTGGLATFTASILEGVSYSSNCDGPISDGGYNLDTGTTCGFTHHALNNTNPLLGPLSNNGGPTQTMALLQGSPAIDYVIKRLCPATDQRGDVRPDNDETVCDIGAYESAY
ncbi:MAG: choice-of-anchor Q domain-containing protein [Ktedonobacteraceae bacterium]